jgi:hypothetical protein
VQTTSSSTGAYRISILQVGTYSISAYIPPPTTSGLAYNYNAAGIRPIIDTTKTIRIDHAFGAKDKIFGSYTARDDVATYTRAHLWLPVTPYITKQNSLPGKRLITVLR